MEKPMKRTIFITILCTLASASTSTLQAERRYYPVGCRPSAGECINSCPERRAMWFEDIAQCEFDPSGLLACYCLVD